MRPMADEQIEITLHIAKEVKVYRIPPRPAAGGHSSGTWRVDDCIYEGRLRITAKGEAAQIQLEDPSSGELFAMCPFTPSTQAVAIEPVVDSSRYYVLRVEDPGTKRHAFLGIGFGDRGAAFDFNATLADHAKQCQREEAVAHHAAAAAAADTLDVCAGSAAAGSGGVAAGWGDMSTCTDLYKDPGDLSLREGQTLRIDVKHRTSKSGSAGFLGRARGHSDGGSNGSSSGGAAVLLQPPPLPLQHPAPLQHSLQQVIQPAGAAGQSGAAAAGNMPAAVTVASSEENWATFD